MGLGRRAEPCGACSVSGLGRGGGDESTFSGVIPPLEHTSSTPSRAAAPAFGALVPSERPRATQRPRSSGTQAPRTVERRAGRTTAPAGSCRCAMGGGAAPVTCAACAARARLWRRATACGDAPARRHRIAPPRPEDASRPASIAGGAAELALICGEGQGTLRVRARRVARVVHAETARVRPGAPTLTVAFRAGITSLVRWGVGATRKCRGSPVGSGRIQVSAGTSPHLPLVIIFRKIQRENSLRRKRGR